MGSVLTRPYAAFAQYSAIRMTADSCGRDLICMSDSIKSVSLRQGRFSEFIKTQVSDRCMNVASHICRGKPLASDPDTLPSVLLCECMAAQDVSWLQEILILRIAQTAMEFGNYAAQHFCGVKPFSIRTSSHFVHSLSQLLTRETGQQMMTRFARGWPPRRACPLLSRVHRRVMPCFAGG